MDEALIERFYELLEDNYAGNLQEIMLQQAILSNFL